MVPTDTTRLNHTVLKREADCGAIQARYPHARSADIMALQGLLTLARDYHSATHRHIGVYGNIGELYAAIVHDMSFAKRNAKGVDGTLGPDHIQVKTITPFKNKVQVVVDTDACFNKLLVVRVTPKFEIDAVMVRRKALPKVYGNEWRLEWELFLRLVE